MLQLTNDEILDKALWNVGKKTTDERRRAPRFFATHDKRFQADDVFVIAALSLLHPGSLVCRTRNPILLSDAGIVVDVGHVFDAQRHRYDHHQWTPQDWAQGRGVRSNGIPYASFGLLWSTGCSHNVVATVLDAIAISPKQCAEVVKRVDERFVQKLDAADVAWQSPHDDAARLPIRDYISALNPSNQADDQTYDAAFVRAVDVAREILRREILATFNATVYAAFDSRTAS
jgi:uncharacterized UPF0160 family protein